VTHQKVKNGRSSDDIVRPGDQSGPQGSDASEISDDGGGELPVGSAGGSGDGPPGDTPTSSDPDAALLVKELESLKDRHLRLAAEFDNYRKRSQHQLGESSARAQAYLAAEIIDVLDDFDRVTAIDPDTATLGSVMEGVDLVKRKMRQVLDGAGLEEIDPTGERFDPNTMEAVLRIPTSSAEEDEKVAQVFQRGYRFRGQLLRPARVSVRKSE
jgi:molecular chaperone GrpE